jgi:hypothetical protein
MELQNLCLHPGRATERLEVSMRPVWPLIWLQRVLSPTRRRRLDNVTVLVPADAN